ncbi:MAG TPA: hypothetical protein VNL98_02710, partial [Gemmatimonadales bacterium]|nr:hypothetical protein [Gemmatimonadales bacterium]
MPLPTVIAALRRLPGFADLARALDAPRSRVSSGRLPGSADAALVAALALERPSRLFVVLAPGPAEAERWLADLTVLLPEDSLALYPQRESLGEEEPHYEIAGERAETLEQLMRGAVRVLVTTARASSEKTLMPAALAAARLEIGPGLAFRDLVARLTRMGYARVPQVQDVAQFSVRGGIVDVYGFGMAQPARMEYWGEDLIEMRSFDLATQRSTGVLERLTVLPVDARKAVGDGPAERRSLLELVPSGALLVEDRMEEAAADVLRAWAEAEHHAEVARRLGEEVPPRAEILVEPEVWNALRSGFSCLAVGTEPATHRLAVQAAPDIARDLRRVRPIEGSELLVLCDNEGQLERLEELLGDGAGQLPAGLTLAIGALDGGFALPGLVVLTDHEIFRRARRLRRARR